MLIYIMLFGGSYLFEEVTFRLPETVLVLLEKNGAGKSTMLFSERLCS
jgi:ABC-type cobalamin/Fe3+-siderophores transport system ATPase subunit